MKNISQLPPHKLSETFHRICDSIRQTFAVVTKFYSRGGGEGSFTRRKIHADKSLLSVKF